MPAIRLKVVVQTDGRNRFGNALSKTFRSNLHGMVDRIRWDTVSYLPFHANYLFFSMSFNFICRNVPVMPKSKPYSQM